MMQGEHRRWINGGKEKKQQTEEDGKKWDMIERKFDSIRR